MIWLANQGFAWHEEAEAKGGDWVGLDTLAAIVVGVVYPGFICVLCVGQFLALLGLRQRGQP